jgi:hypothetical protein
MKNNNPEKITRESCEIFTTAKFYSEKQKKP